MHSLNQVTELCRDAFAQLNIYLEKYCNFSLMKILIGARRDILFCDIEGSQIAQLLKLFQILRIMLRLIPGTTVLLL